MIKEVIDKKGREIKLEVIDTTEIVAYHNNKCLGSFKFKKVQTKNAEAFKVIGMHINMLDDSYLRSGIGSEIICFAQELSTLPIIFDESGADTSDDGSHLIGDGIPFAENIKKRLGN